MQLVRIQITLSWKPQRVGPEIRRARGTRYEHLDVLYVILQANSIDRIINENTAHT